MTMNDHEVPKEAPRGRPSAAPSSPQWDSEPVKSDSLSPTDARQASTAQAGSDPSPTDDVGEPVVPPEPPPYAPNRRSGRGRAKPTPAATTAQAGSDPSPSGSAGRGTRPTRCA